MQTKNTTELVWNVVHELQGSEQAKTFEADKAKYGVPDRIQTYHLTGKFTELLITWCMLC